MITIVIFPLTFVSSAYVPTNSMPKLLEAIANANPVTTIVDALRSLWIDSPAGTDVAFAIVWCAGIALFFSVLATARYRRTVAR
jgi:ABC-2 type transport system permease protein/oleandomycin transport system permease protein